MDTFLEMCSVCLNKNSDLRPINETDPNGSPLSKLQVCIPEIQWKENYTICSSCNTCLDMVHEFREKCLQLDMVRSQEFPDPSENKFWNETFECKFSPETSQVSGHVKTEHKVEIDKPFLCKICKNRFRCSSTLSQHLQRHIGNRNHICSFCGKGFVTRSDLKNHEKIHMNKKEYNCKICVKSFNTHKDLRSHNFVVHTDSNLWKHVCEVCSKRFPVKSNFDAHMRRHNNERPFGCHLCDKRFIEKVVLQKHVLSHSNYRGFACDICGKEYKDKRIMNIHKKKIHGVGDVKVPERVKKYLCHLCPKSYFDRNKLTRHLCTHTGEKPHFCHLCSKKFIDKSYIKVHMKKVHNVEEVLPTNSTG